jgi:Putative zinc-finger
MELLMRGLAMDHNEVVRQKLTERYLLNELEGEQRDQFEEHYFECPECALDIRTGSEFVESSKVILAQPAEETAPAEGASRKPVRQGWWGWLRPQFAAAALALLIAVVGYQNLVTLPQLRGVLRQPQTPPWAAVAVGTWGSSGPTVTVPRDSSFLIFVRIPSDGTYTRYIADLYNPAGGLEYSLTIPATSIEDQWPVLIPGGNHEAGNYRISVRGVAGSGEIKDVGSAPFTLQTQK